VLETSSSRFKIPLSTHCMTATVVMIFVHDAIQQTVSAVNFCWVLSDVLLGFLAFGKYDPVSILCTIRPIDN
jgi:hypothetical protein